MKHMKKIFSLLLVVCMLLTSIPVSAFAAEENQFQIDVKPGRVEVPKLDLFEDSLTAYDLDEDGNPEITDTQEVKWIDRIANLPDWAFEFYDWLAENSDGDKTDDAMINPTTGEIYKIEGEEVYVYRIATTPEKTLEFEFPAGGSDDEMMDAMKNALTDAMEDAFYGDFPYIMNVYGAFDRDYSEVFWLSGETAYLYDLEEANPVSIDEEAGRGTVLYKQNYYLLLLEPGDFDVREPEYRDYTKIYDAIEKRDLCVEEILAEAPETRAEALSYFNEYLIMNNGYNTSSDFSQISNDCYECISALEGKTGTEGPICEGYARAFKLLCDTAGIPCVLVNGTSHDVNHMWNNVEMEDGKWYAVDVTYNDPMVNGNTDKVSGAETDDYFLVGSNTVINEEVFSDTHVATNMLYEGSTQYLNGPVLAEEAYDFEKEEHVHNYASVVTEPTCTEDGYTTYTCLECGDTYTDDVVDAKGHNYVLPIYEWADDYSKCTATFVCSNECGTDVVTDCEVTVTNEDATCTTPGTIVYTASVEFEGETYTAQETEIRELGHDYVPAYTWTDDKDACVATFTCANGCGDSATVNCTVTVKEEEETITYTATCVFKEKEYSNQVVKQIEKVEIPFTDVPEKEWYTKYVLWAYDKEVTVGYKEADGTYTFRPHNNCTRAEIVKFLWNLVGTEVTEDVENPFTDVKEGDWYYECVMWAVSNGITSGYKEADGTYTFRPEATCTRAEVATFVYNVKGGTPVSEDVENPFTDVDEEEWYYKFVIWGYENGIINGYEVAEDTLEFRPHNNITRSEVVTMLYGAFTKNPVTGVALADKSLELIIGDSYQLTYVIAPVDADIKNVTWKSSDESIATVSEDGVITALAKGQTVITVTTRDGGYTAQCELTVREPELIAQAALGIRTFTTDTSSTSEIYVKASATGGSGVYEEYHIKLYLNDELVAESDKYELAFSPIQEGTYMAEIYVKDSSGTEDVITVTKIVTI